MGAEANPNEVDSADLIEFIHRAGSSTTSRQHRPVRKEQRRRMIKTGLGSGVAERPGSGRRIRIIDLHLVGVDVISGRVVDVVVDCGAPETRGGPSYKFPRETFGTIDP